MVSTDDWKEYTRQYDLRAKARGKKVLEDQKQWYKDEDVRREKARIEHEEHQDRMQKMWAEQGVYYIPRSMFYYGFNPAPLHFYPNERTIEGCMDWIVKGRPDLLSDQKKG